MCVLLKIFVFAVQSITFLYTEFWSPYLAQKGDEACESVNDVTRSLCCGQFSPPSLSVHRGSCSESVFDTTYSKSTDGLSDHGQVSTESEKAVDFRLLGPHLNEIERK